jgi:hypothetical protein
LNPLVQKSKKIDPVIKARRLAVELEAKGLMKIRAEKLRLVGQIKHYQKEYLLGVDKVNAERAKSQFEMMSTLESSVDLVKDRWHETLRHLRLAEDREKAQLANLIIARKHLRAVEQLSDRYLKEIVAFQEKLEQKTLDELTLRRAQRTS